MRVNFLQPRQCQGSTLIEGLLAVALFSLGLLALLMLVSASMVESANAQYRSEASLLASDLIGRMWTGDRSYTGIVNRFGDSTKDDFKNWLNTVKDRLPGVSETTNTPTVAIDANRDRKSTRLNSSHIPLSRMPSSA